MLTVMERPLAAPPPTSGAWPPRRTIALLALLLAAAIATSYWVEIVSRAFDDVDPIVHVPNYDFFQYYAGGYNWNLGLDPYTNHPGVPGAIQHPRFDTHQISGYIYPPTFLPVYGALADYRYDDARRAWLAITLSAFALLIAFVIIITTEPFLLRAAPPSEYRVKLVIPVLANVATPAPAPLTSNPSTMDKSTIISIGIFALFQIVIYMICLMKISEIDRQDLPPALKLRLMENEENLFDSGLYVGMTGTATALVLQVLGVIDPNLLAAYSSNLFGIVCVAFVKIRHVRGYKRQLIMAAQRLAAPAAPTTPLAS